MLEVLAAEPQRHRWLTVFPLVTPAATELPYALLVEALESGSLQINEIGSGSVAELLAINKGSSDVLILDGEQLIGARQNRMTNRSLLLAAGSENRIPVSCMEQGRWHFVSDKFMPSPQHSPAAVRRKARELEALYADAAAPPPPEALAQAQSGVWSSIAEHALHVGAHSPTGALNDLFDARALDVDGWVERFAAVDGQVGLLAFAGGRPLGLDVIGGRTLYARLHERLLRGYVMDALAQEQPEQPVEPAAAQAYLDRVRAARRVPASTVGKGSYAALSGEVVGGELLDGDRLVHLSAFPQLDRRERPTGEAFPSASPIAPPSRRRRRR